MILFYPFALYLAYQIFYHSSLATNSFESAVSYLDLASQSELAWKSFLEALSLNLYEGASKVQEEILILSEQASTALVNATKYSLCLCLLSIFYFLYLHFIKKISKETFIVHLVLVAFIFLLIGLTTTMLSLVAFRDLPIIGTVVFKFESKTIFSVLQTFWIHDKYFVLLLVFLFSVMVPSLKLLLSLSIALDKQGKYKDRALKIIHAIGKWSMTDVFVVAVLLAFFTMNVDQTTDAWLGHGLYFFAIYSVLSIIIGHLIIKKSTL